MKTTSEINLGSKKIMKEEIGKRTAAKGQKN